MGLNDIIDKYKTYFKSLTLDEYNDRTKIMVLIDSIGFLGSQNSEKNLKKKKVVQELSLTKQLKALFRDLTIDLNVCQVPLILVNHVYDDMNEYATSTTATEDGKVVSGGSAGRYGASAILYLSTKQKKEDAKTYSDKDGVIKDKRVTTGTFFTAKAMKGRYVRAGSSVDLYLDYEKGIAKNFGLQKFVEDGGLVERVNRGAKGTFFKILSKKKEDGTYDEVKDYVTEIPNM